MRVFFFSVERVLLNERASVGLSVSSLCPLKVFKHGTYLHTYQIMVAASTCHHLVSPAALPRIPGALSVLVSEAHSPFPGCRGLLLC
jgi:hypothetical protein